MRFRKWNVNCTGRLLIASKPVDSIFKVNIKLYRWIVRFDWMLSGAWVDSRKHKTEMPINSVFLNKSQHVLCNTGPKRMVWTIFGLRAHFCIFSTAQLTTFACTKWWTLGNVQQKKMFAVIYWQSDGECDVRRWTSIDKHEQHVQCALLWMSTNLSHSHQQ